MLSTLCTKCQALVAPFSKQNGRSETSYLGPQCMNKVSPVIKVNV